MSEPLLDVRDLSCTRERNQKIFSGVNFSVNQGDVVVLQGKSGSGKTTLLKCLAHLNTYGGVPTFRTRVLYVPQRASLLPGTPRDFLTRICAFQGRRSGQVHGNDGRPGLDLQHPEDIARSWGIDSVLWDREWAALSGGEAQRIVLAVALGMDTAEILLLDEPTSALDPESSLMVENTLISELHASESCLKAVVWITHSGEQGRRVGTRFLHLSATGCHENAPDEEV